MKIISIVGARPQFIKYAPLSKELGKLHHNVLIHTGQHYDYQMSKIFFDELGIPEPDFNLGIGSNTHAYQTGEMMKNIEDILNREQPDMVIVYGDTNSTLAGALAAVKLHIKLAHVESGIRIYDKSVAEEVNRVVTDYCSDFLFCPTQTASENLARENITHGVYLTGDVMVDALTFNKGIAEKSDVLDKLGLKHKQYAVVTLHRASNTDIRQNLESISSALIKLGEMGQVIVFPAHPRTVKMLKTNGLFEKLNSHVKMTEPLGYLEFLKLMNHADKILTDSGGIQKEAYILNIPCITLFEKTPWPETTNDGWNLIAGVNTDKIIELSLNFNIPQRHPDYFGQGACLKINDIISKMPF
jgi:UDP-GlcNAc3NAcA epimerase